MDNQQDFQGVNLGYVLELYDRYLRDPNSVDAKIRVFFKHWKPPEEERRGAGTIAATEIDKIVGTVNLAESIRKFGHMDARIDPLGGEPARRLFAAAGVPRGE